MKRLFSILTLALVALGMMLPQHTTRAATLTVTTTADGGPGSFRQAVIDAASGDTIDFAVTGTITFAFPVTINKNLTITGPGAGSLAFSGGGTSQILQIALGMTVNISGLTFRDGIGTLNLGGAIANGGILTINNCTFTNNHVTDTGGAIINGGSLTVTNSTFTNNSAFDDGGAIASAGFLSVTSSIFSGNTAGDRGGAIANGAISSIPGGGIVVVAASTFTNNTADTGGAIAQNFVGSSTTITQSNIFGNTALSGQVVQHIGGDPISAPGNWWGAADGPAPVGSGDSISANVAAISPLASMVGGGSGGSGGSTGGSTITPDVPYINTRGDLVARIYAAFSGGLPALHIYCLGEGTYLGLVVSSADLADYPERPASNTLVARSSVCPVAFYILTTGEYQVNIGPDREGKTYVTIFRGLPPSGVYGYQLSLAQ